MNKSICFALLAVLALAAGPGCKTRRITAAGIMMESYPQNLVKVNSRIFGGWFRISNSALAKGENELLRATVSLESLKDEDAQIEYRYRWIDADGIEVSSGNTLWLAKGAGARETVLLTDIAPTKRAVDFILDVRFIRASTRW